MKFHRRPGSRQLANKTSSFVLCLFLLLNENHEVYGFSSPAVRLGNSFPSATAPPSKQQSLTSQLFMYVDWEAGSGGGGTNGAVAEPPSSGHKPIHETKNGHDPDRIEDNGVEIPDTMQIGNVEVPSIGIGTISWSSNNLFDLENDELRDLVIQSRASNAAFFDTAERYGSHIKTALGLGYGETEQMLAKFVSESKAVSTSQTLEPVVATKFTPLPWRTTVDSVVKACEESCRRLGVDQIDLYQLHMPDIVQPLKHFGITSQKSGEGHDQMTGKDEIYWQGLAECYNRGLVKNVGVCNYGPTLLRQCQAKLAQYGVPLASNQIAYSLIGRHNGAQETVDYCNQNGIQVLAFYPLAMGLLTGKYSRQNDNRSKPLLPLEEQKKVNDVLRQSSKTVLEHRDLQKYADNADGALAKLLEVMEEIAQAHGPDVTISQVALNYIMCKNVIPIPGARNTAQLMDNIGAMGWRLSPQEVERLETTTDALGLSGFEGAGFKRTSEKFVGYGVEKWSLN